VAVGLAEAEALLLEHLGEAQQVGGAHLKVGVVQEENLQQEGLLPETLAEPPRDLPLRLKHRGVHAVVFYEFHLIRFNFTISL